MSTSLPDNSFEEIKKGNQKSFEVLFRKLYSDLVRYAFKITRDQSAAEEIVQDIFLYLWEKRNQLDVKGSIDSYLYSAVKNRCINWLKIELPKLQVTIDISDYEQAVRQSDNDENEEKVKKQLIDSAINRLPEKCREIFILSRSAGLTYQEIAEDLDISVKTVENQMGIALKKLRIELKPLMDDERFR